MGDRMQVFAHCVLAELRQRDRRAEALCLKPGRPVRGVVMGLVDEGDFVPLLKLGSASAAVNVMSLFVLHHGHWMPTFERGTPIQLAEALAGPLQYLWTLAVTAQSTDSGSSAQ